MNVEPLLQRQMLIVTANHMGNYIRKNHQGLQLAIELFNSRDENKLTVQDMAEKTGISRRMIYREANKKTRPQRQNKRL